MDESKSIFGVDSVFVNQCVSFFDKTTHIDPYDSLTEEMSHVIISSAVVAKIYGITAKDLEKEIDKKREKYRFCRV